MIKWVSCKERLPDDRQRVLIWDRRSHVSYDGTSRSISHIYVARFYQGEYRPSGPWRSCDTGFGNNENPWSWEEGAQKWFSQDITYWMPLPNNPIQIEGKE